MWCAETNAGFIGPNYHQFDAYILYEWIYAAKLYVSQTLKYGNSPAV